MCGAMQVGDNLHRIGKSITVHGLDENSGKKLTARWNNFCRIESLESGIWASRFPQEALVDASAYFEKGAKYEVGEDEGLLFVLADKLEGEGRELYLVTKGASQDLIDEALRQGKPSHDRHPVRVSLQRAGLQTA